MKDFFNRLDEATNNKNKAESEKQRISGMYYEQAERYANKLADFLKPYIAAFEERNYRCTEKLDGAYYKLRIATRDKSVEVAIVNSNNIEIGFEFATYENEFRTHYNVPTINNDFDEKVVAAVVEEVFGALI